MSVPHDETPPAWVARFGAFMLSTGLFLGFSLGFVAGMWLS